MGNKFSSSSLLIFKTKKQIIILFAYVGSACELMLTRLCRLVFIYVVRLLSTISSPSSVCIKELQLAEFWSPNLWGNEFGAVLDVFAGTGMMDRVLPSYSQSQ